MGCQIVVVRDEVICQGDVNCASSFTGSCVRSTLVSCLVR